jgi:hypothetical protein
MRVVAFAIAAGLLMSPAAAQAQARRTYWGVTAGIAPAWETPTQFKTFFNADDLTFSGSDLSIGFVRGAILEGDWGVSFVRRKVSDNATVSRAQATPLCANCGAFFTMSGVSMSAVEIHRFAPFGTIKQRVQIGLLASVGVASLDGTVRDQVVFTPRAGVIQSITSDVKASTLFAPAGHDLSVVPTGKLELAVAGIIGPDLKIRASGGINFPGYEKFSLSVIYLIKAR